MRTLRFHRFILNFKCLNQSFTQATNIRSGIIQWANAPIDNDNFVGEHFLSQINTQNIDESKFANHWEISHRFFFKKEKLEPSSSVDIDSVIRLAIPDGPFTPTVWRAGIYLSQEGSQPHWYQLTLHITTEFLKSTVANENIIAGSHVLQIRPLSNEQPIVAIETI